MNLSNLTLEKLNELVRRHVSNVVNVPYQSEGWKRYAAIRWKLENAILKKRSA